MSTYHRVRAIIEETLFVDTHEHLIEESVRLAGPQSLSSGQKGLFPCDDWTYIFHHYFADDLASAGLTPEAARTLFGTEADTETKYRLLAPFWEKTKHTGYGQSVRHTLRGLYGEDDLTEESAPRIAEKYRETVQPGFYAAILRDKCRLEHCQVNSLQSIFHRTEQPELLRQDIGFPSLSTDLDPARVEREFGKTAATLDGWLEIIDGIFAACGPSAVAAKNQSAYSRRLDYADVPKETAAPLFVHHARGEKLAPEERKALGDYLFRYCVRKATEHRLPVKLHTGYYAGHNYMQLARPHRNASDLCPLLSDFPDTNFVLMHLGWPYQDEMIALAKHYRNVTIDMCWTWIINPAASVRFVKEFLMAAPANKLLTFGGDYIPVEPIYGHSRIARLGLTQALTELIETGWIAEEEAPALIARLMNGNAHELFPRFAGY